VRRRAAALGSLGAALCAALALARPAPAHEGEPPQPEPAFALPAPGSYELPPIARVPEFTLLDERGAPAPLLGLAAGQVAVVGFAYAHCPQGCPAALAVLQRVDRALAADPALAGRVRLATVSFDPARDTPERMADLRARLRPAADWRFLTAADAPRIAPVLAAFGQDALPLVDPRGRGIGLFRHVLKVFLVDAEGGVRNVYSSGFLSPELLLVDARTVLLEGEAARPHAHGDARP
jgi:cytochrome oxidase Cu insertion factor (SCO1/SenC/PrrC family)